MLSEALRAEPKHPRVARLTQLPTECNQEFP